MKLKLTYLIAWAALAGATSAHAAFYVNDDAPIVTAANPQSARQDTTSYVSFYGTRLSRSGKSTLEGMNSALLAADNINVSAYAKNKNQLQNAKRRVAAVKDWLVQHGVANSKIQTYTEVDPEDDASDTDVQIAARSSTLTPTAETMRSAQLVSTSPAAQLPAPTPAQKPQPAISDQVRLDFARRIMAMAQAKVISADDAMRLIAEFLDSNGTTQTAAPSAAPVQALPQQTPSLAAAQPIVGGPIQIAAAQIVPTADAMRSWTLAADKSLHQNIDDWAQIAGYGKPAWSASVPYQVTYTSTYTGTFLEVLGRIANAVPALDIQVSKGHRTITVVDAKQ